MPVSMSTDGLTFNNGNTLAGSTSTPAQSYRVNGMNLTLMVGLTTASWSNNQSSSSQGTWINSNYVMTYTRKVTNSTIVVDSALKGTMALQSAGANYLGVSMRLKIVTGANTTYTSAANVWARYDFDSYGQAVKEIQSMKSFVEFYGAGATFGNAGDLTTITVQYQLYGGSGTSAGGLGMWGGNSTISIMEWIK